MKKLLFALMLLFPIAAGAQEEKNRPFEEIYQSLDTMSLDNRAQVETNLKLQEEKFRKEQVKSICGVPFGSIRKKRFQF